MLMCCGNVVVVFCCVVWFFEIFLSYNFVLNSGKTVLVKVHVRGLRIKFEDVTEINLDINLSEKANALVDRLKPLNVSAVDEYLHLKKDQGVSQMIIPLLDDVLIETVSMISKYAEIESPFYGAIAIRAGLL